MSSNVDELTIHYEEDGQCVVKEIDKAILSKGAWTTILFRFQEWKNDTDTYGPDKYTIRRYRKIAGEYKYQSKFTISSADQAKKIIDTLEKWIKDTE